MLFANVPLATVVIEASPRLRPTEAARIIRAHGIEAYAVGQYVEAIPTASVNGQLVEHPPVLIKSTVRDVRDFLGY